MPDVISTGREVKTVKRAVSSSLSPLASDSEIEEPPRRIKPKRAETRVCPVCDEPIPLRLLSRHVLLESQRLDEIIHEIGSTQSIRPLDDFCSQDGPGPSTRRSALKARRSFRSHASPSDTLEQASKGIQTIKRHRKQRHARLRELTRELDDEGTSSGVGLSRNSLVHGLAAGEIQCPVCQTTVPGDEDVLEAHIDACLADHGRRIEEEHLRMIEGRRIWESMEVAGGVGHVGDVTGTGFHTRNANERDVDDEVDVDGDDQAVYGEAQFTEGDVISLTNDSYSADLDEDVHVEIEGETEDDASAEPKTLRDLVAEGKMVRRETSVVDGTDAVRVKMNEVMGLGDTERLDRAITTARSRGDHATLISALENKVRLLVSSPFVKRSSWFSD
ncbi:hypothetical protein AX17_001188 [Amanita inopinata Kibby_2008]|nr:hypothetical protein AX17_001188 [Amanita inopinata Kibby_2008]